MFKALRQLFADLQDKNAGVKISQWPVKTPLLLWTKYFAVLAVIIILTVIYSLVYYIPQLPKFVGSSVPNLTVTLNHNLLSVSPPDPIKLTSADGSIIVDSREKPDDYSSYSTGVFVYRDHTEIKDTNGKDQKFDYKNLKPFSYSKPQLVTWLNQNKGKLTLVLVPIVLLLSLFASAIIWGIKVLGFYIWSAVFFLLFKAFHRPLEFKQILPVVIYASILPLLISYILFFAPHPLLNFLNFILFLFFSLSWLMPLTKPVSSKKKEII